MNPILRGKVAQGKLILDQPSRYLVRLSQLEGKRIELVIRKEKSQRSLNQNSYMWGVVYEIISQHTGYTPEEVHEIMKFKFLKTEKAGMEYVRSTASLNTAEMGIYLENIRRWAAVELGCFIPLPNEIDYSEVVNR